MNLAPRKTAGVMTSASPDGPTRATSSWPWVATIPHAYVYGRPVGVGIAASGGPASRDGAASLPASVAASRSNEPASEAHGSACSRRALTSASVGGWPHAATARSRVGAPRRRHVRCWVVMRLSLTPAGRDAARGQRLARPWNQQAIARAALCVHVAAPSPPSRRRGHRGPPSRLPATSTPRRASAWTARPRSHGTAADNRSARVDRHLGSPVRSLSSCGTQPVRPTVERSLSRA